MPFIRIAFKNQLAYRLGLVFGVLWPVFSIGVSLALWRFLYQGDAAMQAYMTRYMVLSGVLANLYQLDIGMSIGNKVLDGSIAMDLIRPVNLLAQVWCTQIGEILSRLLFGSIPAFLIFLPAFLGGPALHNVAPAIAAVGLGFVFLGFLQAFIGYASFILVEARPFLQIVRAVQTLFSGAVIPLVLFPGALRTIADALPFRFLYSFPLTLLLGERVEWGSAGFREILGNYALMLVWIAVLYVLTNVTRWFALRKFVVLGG